MTDHSGHLQRVSSKIAGCILTFFERAGVGATFTMGDLSSRVENELGEKLAPDSPGRVLRELRRTGKLNYRVIDRRKSLYQIIKEEPKADVGDACARLVVVGDIHLRARPPRSRRDDYAAAIVKKLHSVGKIVREEAATHAVLVGDLFDSPDVSLTVIGEALDAFDSWRTEIVVIAGNHDVIGQNPATLHRTILGHILEREEQFRYIGDYGTGIPSWLAVGETWAIAGLDHRLGIERMLLDEEYGKRWTSAMYPRFVALVTHAQVTPQPFDVTESLRPEDIRWPVAVAMCGHYHPGCIGRTTGLGMPFVNPGSLCRLAYMESNLLRPIQVGVVDLFPDGRSTVRYRVVDHAPAKEVFAVDEAELRRSRSDAADVMIESLLAAGAASTGMTAEQAVLTVAKENETPQPIVADVMARLHVGTQ